MKRLTKGSRRGRDPLAVAPLPGAIDGRGWDVRDSRADQPRTSLAKRLMQVPMTPGERTRQVQLHEMAHVAFTPRGVTPASEAKRYRLPAAIVEGLEDARLTKLLARYGLPQDEPLLSEKAEQQLPYALLDPGIATAMLAASHGTGDAAKVDAAIDRLCTGILPYYGGPTCAAVAAPDGGRAIFHALAARLAQALDECPHDPAERDAWLAHVASEAEAVRQGWQEALAGMPERMAGYGRESAKEGGIGPSSGARFVSPGKPGRGDLSAIEAAAVKPEDDPAEPTTEEILKALEQVSHADPENETAMAALAKIANAEPVPADAHMPKRLKADGTPDYRYIAERGIWQPLSDPLLLPLKVRLPKARIPKGRRGAVDAGAVPRFLHRAAIDERVFAANRTRDGRGGAVLIDLSGSMSLTAGEVRQLLEAIPAGIVAGYSAHVIAILARRGRAVDDEGLNQALYAMPGQNASDGPALRWLAAQRGPRFWVCDGGITGIGDSACSLSMRDEVTQLVLRHRILRIPNVETVVKRYAYGKRRLRRRTG